MKDLNDLVAVREEQYFLFSVMFRNFCGDPHTPRTEESYVTERRLSAAIKQAADFGKAKYGDDT